MGTAFFRQKMEVIPQYCVRPNFYQLIIKQLLSSGVNEFTKCQVSISMTVTQVVGNGEILLYTFC